MRGASFGFVVVLGILAAACHPQPLNETPPACSDAWFAYIEQRVQSGDADGHGPDMGSLEWRSVVEFELGIRDDPRTPASTSDGWCQ